MSLVKTDCFVTPADLDAALRRDVAHGLSRTPKELPAKWFYDERGSELFEEITQLDEYYPTRRERSILSLHADEIAKAASAGTLMELGAGSGQKTRILLDALLDAGSLETYIPVDVSGDYLQESAEKIAADYPDIRVHAVVADHDRHLQLLPSLERRLIAFLGSTIGNMAPRERGRFLGALRAIMRQGDTVLLGVDLVKDQGRLVRAYDDAKGVTAAFNRNVLSVINRGLDADFDLDRFQHVAAWDELHERMEMRLHSTRDQVVHIRELGLRVAFSAGEEMRTEISSKFRRSGLEQELSRADLDLMCWWVDADGDYAVCLARPGQ